jgi:RHS repeat-associated protein
VGAVVPCGAAVRRGEPVIASVTRFVWDGDQVLGEFRMPVTQQENDLTPIFTWMPIPDSLGLLHRGDGSDSVQTYSWMWGRSIYVHGLGIDQPIAIVRAESGDSATLFDPFVMYPLTDWRGNVSSVSFADGSPLRFGNLRATPPLPTEQNSELTAYRQRGASTWTVSSWVGSLINGQFGASGLEYRRNRYYDPQQGRFTQEDPIGLAGGMNLYGFAGGDPVNFQDPFGLTPDCLVLPCPVVAAAGGTTLGAVLGVVGMVGAPIAAVVALDQAFGPIEGSGQVTTRAASDATATVFAAGRGRSKNDIPLTGGPPNGVVTKPGTSVVYGPDGNAVTRTCAKAGHGCDGAHTHDYVTGPNGKVNQKGQPRPATEEEKQRTPPPNP